VKNFLKFEKKFERFNYFTVRSTFERFEEKSWLRILKVEASPTPAKASVPFFQVNI
jgi:hypothetical protein